MLLFEADKNVVHSFLEKFHSLGNNPAVGSHRLTSLISWQEARIFPIILAIPPRSQ